MGAPLRTGQVIDREDPDRSKPAGQATTPVLDVTATKSLEVGVVELGYSGDVFESITEILKYLNTYSERANA